MHGGYLHRKSFCRVTLDRRGKQPLEVRGRVFRCDYLKANVHELGIQIINPIDFTGVLLGMAANNDASAIVLT